MKQFPSYILALFVITLAYALWQDIGTSYPGYLLTTKQAIQMIAAATVTIGGSWYIGYLAAKK